MKNVSSFEEFVNEDIEYDDYDIFSHNVVPVDRIKELMDRFDISEEEAAKIDELVYEIYSMDDFNDKMDYVEGLELQYDIQDEDKCEEIIQYLKDICLE